MTTFLINIFYTIRCTSSTIGTLLQNEGTVLGQPLMKRIFLGLLRNFFLISLENYGVEHLIKS